MGSRSSLMRLNGYQRRSFSNQGLNNSQPWDGGMKGVFNSQHNLIGIKGGEYSFGYESTLPTLMVRYRTTVEEVKDDPTYMAGAAKVMRLLHGLWLDQSMCDVILETEGGTLLAHQVALSAYSPALSVLFRTKQGSRIQQTAHMNLRDFTLRTVTDIVNFVYTTVIELDCKNIGEVLACARQLDMLVIVDMCQKYLVEMASVENLILHYSVAANNDLIEIRDKLQAEVVRLFSLVYTQRHFLFLPFDRLLSILSSDALCADEMDVFLAIVRWVDYCRSERLPFAGQLLQLVRFQLIEPGRLTREVHAVEWLFVDRASIDAVLEAFKFHALNCSQNDMLASVTPQSPRCNLPPRSSTYLRESQSKRQSNRPSQTRASQMMPRASQMPTARLSQQAGDALLLAPEGGSQIAADAPRASQLPPSGSLRPSQIADLPAMSVRASQQIPLGSVRASQVVEPPPAGSIRASQIVEPPPAGSIRTSQIVEPPPAGSIRASQIVEPPPAGSIRASQLAAEPLPIGSVRASQAAGSVRASQLAGEPVPVGSVRVSQLVEAPPPSGSMRASQIAGSMRASQAARASQVVGSQRASQAARASAVGRASQGSRVPTIPLEPARVSGTVRASQAGGGSAEPVASYPASLGYGERTSRITRPSARPPSGQGSYRSPPPGSIRSPTQGSLMAM